MDGLLLVLILVVVGAIGLVVWRASRNSANRNATSLADAKADARRAIDRLGGQVLNLSGTDDASKQALADASERFNAAGGQIDQATTAKQALLAKESALEGLYYVRAARTAMGMDPGPELESPQRAEVRRNGHRGPTRRVRGPPDRGLTQPDRTHPELLPRRPRRGPAGSGRLVLRAVVETRVGRRSMGRRLGVPVQRVVLGHGRGRLRRRGVRRRTGRRRRLRRRRRRRRRGLRRRRRRHGRRRRRRLGRRQLGRRRHRWSAAATSVETSAASNPATAQQKSEPAFQPR